MPDPGQPAGEYDLGDVATQAPEALGPLLKHFQDLKNQGADRDTVLAHAAALGLRLTAPNGDGSSTDFTNYFAMPPVTFGQNLKQAGKSALGAYGAGTEQLGMAPFSAMEAMGGPRNLVQNVRQAAQAHPMLMRLAGGELGTLIATGGQEQRAAAAIQVSPSVKPGFLNTTLPGMAGGLASALPLAAAGPGALAAGMGAQGFAGGEEEATKAGVTGAGRLAYAGGQAGINVGLGLLGPGGSLARGGAGSLARGAMQAGLAGGAAQGATNVLKRATGVQPNVTLGEGVGEAAAGMGILGAAGEAAKMAFEKPPAEKPATPPAEFVQRAQQRVAGMPEPGNEPAPSLTPQQQASLQRHFRDKPFEAHAPGDREQQFLQALGEQSGHTVTFAKGEGPAASYHGFGDQQHIVVNTSHGEPDVARRAVFLGEIIDGASEAMPGTDRRQRFEQLFEQMKGADPAGLAEHEAAYRRAHEERVGPLDEESGRKEGVSRYAEQMAGYLDHALNNPDAFNELAKQPSLMSAVADGVIRLVNHVSGLNIDTLESRRLGKIARKLGVMEWEQGQDPKLMARQAREVALALQDLMAEKPPEPTKLLEAPMDRALPVDEHGTVYAPGGPQDYAPKAEGIRNPYSAGLLPREEASAKPESTFHAEREAAQAEEYTRQEQAGLKRDTGEIAGYFKKLHEMYRRRETLAPQEQARLDEDIQAMKQEIAQKRAVVPKHDITELASKTIPQRLKVEEAAPSNEIRPAIRDPESEAAAQAKRDMPTPPEKQRQRKARFSLADEAGKLDVTHPENRKEAYDWLRRKFTDEFERVRTIPSRLAKSVADKDVLSDVIRVMPGRIGESFERLKKGMVEPAIDTLVKARIHPTEDKPGKPSANTYHIALGAEQRNATLLERAAREVATTRAEYKNAESASKPAVLAKLTADEKAKLLAADPKNDALSGMTDAEARAAIERAQAGPQSAAYAKLKSLNRSRNKFVLDKMLESGLMSADQRAAWEKAFGPDYTPNKTIPQEEEVQRWFSSTGLQERGPLAKPAIGRESKATNVMASSYADAAMSIQRSEKNRFGQALGRVLEEGGTLQRMKRGLEPIDDKWQLYTSRSAVPKAFEGQLFSWKEDGKDVFLHVPDQQTFEQLKRLQTYKLDGFLRFTNKIARVMKGLHTKYNPAFYLPNTMRDQLSALLNQGTEQSFKSALRIVNPKQTFNAMRAINHVELGKEGGGEVADAYRAFKAAGGKLSFVETRDARDFAKDLEKAVTRAESGGKAAFFDMVDRLGVQLERFGNMSENSTRLSAFMEAKRQGKTDLQAASFAKQLTIDFNQKGQWAPLLDSWKLFFSANATGTERVFRGITTNRKKQALFAGLVGAGYTFAQMSRGLMGQDANGKDNWDNILDYEKAKYLMFPDGGDSNGRVTVPMPWVYNAPWFLGTMIEATQRGRDPISATLSAAKQLADAASPFGVTQTIAQDISPWFISPFVDVGENQSWAGYPIMPPEDPHARLPKPMSERYFKTVSPTLKAGTTALNSLTGGDQIKGGLIDISPEAVGYLMASFSGGAGGEVLRTAKWIDKLRSGTETSSRDVPVYQRFVRSDNQETATRTQFYDNLREVEEAKQRVKVLGQQDVRRTPPWRMQSFANQTEAAVKALKEMKAKLPEARQANIDQVISKRMQNFNRAYSRAKASASVAAQ